MAELFDIGIFSVNDTDGSVGAGWKLNFYQTGTSTRQDTYPTEADADAGTNANANPVVATAAGRFPEIWLKTTGNAYKSVLTDANDVVKVTRDPAIFGPTRALASTDSGKGAALVGRETGGTVAQALTGLVNVAEHGVVGDGSTDDTAAFIAAINALSNGDTLDLGGLHLNIFVGVTGAASGDAIAIAGVPRLYNKSNITIQNGKITADSPAVSGSKLRYPTSLTIDGCTNVTLRDLIVHSKGEDYGDTDASSGESAEDRREFAAQNGGHAILVVRSQNTTVIDCETRLCGSVGSLYVMSSHNTNLIGCFSNPGSLGYAAYAFDSWAGATATSGFPAHCATMTTCAASKEGYTYGSKGCVLTEDADVSVTVNGGFFADAYANGTSRDIGYAFGCSSSQTIVNGAVVENCAALGYTATTTSGDYSYLKVSNVHATGLRKTVHQDEDTSVGRTYAEYTNVTADVAGGGVWAGDGDITREETSYLALPNDGNRIGHTLTNCFFTGATNCILTDNQVFGSAIFTACKIETDGFLWNVEGIGGGANDQGIGRGLVFDTCAIEDVSSETDPYCQWNSTTLYVHVDLSTSTIELNSVRDTESSSISTPGTFISKYEFPRAGSRIWSINASETLAQDAAKIQRIDNIAGAHRNIGLPREDKYKYRDFLIHNANGTYNLLVKDYTLTTTLVTLAPGETATCFNDGTNNYAFKL